MSRPSKKNEKRKERVRTLRAKSPTGQVVVVTRGDRTPAGDEIELPPCLRVHRAERILP